MTSQCEFHGFDKPLCPGCRKDAEVERRNQIKAETHAYIISAWHEDGKYSYGNAVNGKHYKSRAVAERACNKGNEEYGVNRVVRFVALPKKDGGVK